MVKKLISVDAELWRQVRVRAAEMNRSVSGFVSGALRCALESPTVTLTSVPRERVAVDDGAGAVETAPAVPPARKTVAQVREMVAAVSPVAALAESEYEDARCKNCGERWAFHQLGASKTLAKNGCRRFVEAA